MRVDTDVTLGVTTGVGLETPDALPATSPGEPPVTPDAQPLQARMARQARSVTLAGALRPSRNDAFQPALNLMITSPHSPISPLSEAYSAERW